MTTDQILCALGPGSSELPRIAAKRLCNGKANADEWIDAAIEDGQEDELRYEISVLAAAAERSVEYKHHTLGYIHTPTTCGC